MKVNIVNLANACTERGGCSIHIVNRLVDNKNIEMNTVMVHESLFPCNRI